METAVIILELITFSLMIIFLSYNLILFIKDRIESKKAEKELNENLNQLKDAIIKKIMEAEVKVTEKKVSKPSKNKKDYEDMNISELKNVAKERKIKGYYNLKKDQLIKTLKETEILPE